MKKKWLWKPEGNKQIWSKISFKMKWKKKTQIQELIALKVDNSPVMSFLLVN